MKLNKDDGNYLIDFYGDLLTERQKEVLEYYFAYDYTMQEIADNLSISKPAVADIIHRSFGQLLDYEDKLHLYQSFKEREAVYGQLTSLEIKEVDRLVERLIDIDKR